MTQNTVLSNAGPKRRGSPVPIILTLLVLGAGGYFGWRAFSNYQADKRRRQEAIRAENERIRAMNEKLMADDVKPETNATAKVEADEPKFDLPPEPPKKSEAEILREEETFRTNVWAQIEAARKNGDAKPIPAFAGIRFGEPLVPGATLDQVSSKIVKWGTALKESAGDSVSERGVAFAVYGPKLSKPFMSLGTSPLVWVTPQQRRPYRIEFSRPLALKADRHDPETANLVETLKKRFKVEPFAPRPSVPGRAGCEYVFPMGPSTVMVGEYDGVLRFSVEREDVRDAARAETEALRQEKRRVSADGALLDSKRYPNGGFDRAKYRGMKPFREGTPPAFCGVVFGSQPAETATVVVPQNGPKGFFLDYVMAKCPPFRGFAYGRADIDPVRGGVYAVHLTSEGGTEGQDDKDYYESVKASLSGHYKVSPKESASGGALPALTYQIGDLTVVFGPDPRGGFSLNAENNVLASLAGTSTAEPKIRKR